MNGKMQLPISSLNECHSEEYEFNFDTVFSYFLTNAELEKSKIVSTNPEVRALLNIPALYEEKQKQEDEEMDFEE